jgi:hypothetical protein
VTWEVKANEASAAWHEELQSSSDAAVATAIDELQRRDDTVEMISGQDLRRDVDNDSDDNYRSLLRQSLVLVDSYAEIGAYTAAIQALEWHIPYIVRKLPGHVEYLDHDYPLCYSTLDDVQTLLDDNCYCSKDWWKRTIIQRRELSASSTIENLARHVVDCTLAAMSGWAHD